MLKTYRNIIHLQHISKTVDGIQLSLQFNCCGSAIGSEDYGPNPELYPQSCVEDNWTKVFVQLTVGTSLSVIIRNSYVMTTTNISK